LLGESRYLCTLPLAQIQNARTTDRQPALAAVFGPAGGRYHAVAIIISTFGCNNGLIWLVHEFLCYGARWIVFKSTGTLNEKGVPGSALIYQGIWITVLILLRTRRVSGLGRISYGNLYSDLLITSSFRHSCFMS